MTAKRATVYRHFLYYHLWDALAPELRECPICFPRTKILEKAITYLFDENATDPDINEALGGSFGFTAESMRFAPKRSSRNEHHLREGRLRVRRSFAGRGLGVGTRNPP